MKLTARALLGQILALAMLIAPNTAFSQINNAIAGNNGTVPTPPGLFVTPVAPLKNATQQTLNPGLANYPNFVAGEAIKALVSPNHNTLAILTAGQNSLISTTGPAVDPAASTQFIFLYNISGQNEANPVLKQVIQQTNAHVGLAWSADSNTLYAAGGSDDAVYVYTNGGNATAPFAQSAKITLNHAGVASGPLAPYLLGGLGGQVLPNASGLALTPDGTMLVVANNYNDSISVINTATKAITYELDLRPYASGAPNGTKGGTYPYSVVIAGNASSGFLAYVGSDRDREVVVVNLTVNQSTGKGTVVTRIPLDGNANGMTLSADRTTLYVAQDNADEVAVISTASNTVTAKVDTRGPASLGLPVATTGAAPTAVTINPVNNTLYAVNAGSNSVAVIPLSGPGALTATALIPTAYDPTDIAFSQDGQYMYIINGKSDTGPNPGYPYGSLANVKYITYPGGNAAQYARLIVNNQYQFQLEHATLVTASTPAPADLAALTAQVAANNNYPIAQNSATVQADSNVMSFLRQHIQHVIYIVKENRTFDQMLGDLGNGSNGSASLTLFGSRVTPSFHSLSSNFVTLDNFMDPGDGSMDGWSWSTQGRVTNTETLTQQINYAFVNRGLSYESEGSNRNIPVDLDDTARNVALGGLYNTVTNYLPGGPTNLLAGNGDHAATDSPSGYQQGYIFDAVLNAGKTIRDYGFMVDNVGAITDSSNNPIINPFTAGVVQAIPVKSVMYLNNYCDEYFRGFDQAYPDYWRYLEWNREFQQYVANGNLPSFEMVRLSHDHTGSFGSALGGVNTPELQEADDDYSVGLLVQAVAQSPYAGNTLIISVEDDSQDGADHVDSHRSTTYVVGPYVKKRAVVSTRYSQVNVLRTIEDILSTQHLNLNTANARPMSDVFDVTSNGAWSFTAVASTLLKQTTLGLPQTTLYAKGADLKPTHPAEYWAKLTRGFDFSSEDRVPTQLYNEILWKGIKGTKAPATHTQFAKAVEDKDDDK
jgi:DNA-binding beta-propeller fold protein YncE